MFVERAVEATDELLSALERLLPQLGAKKTSLSRDELTSLLASGASSLLIARHPDENGEIVGALALAIYRVPTGVRSIVEDVVVDEKFRRMGIARALLVRAIELVREEGASSMTLTSSPHRQAANLLYRKMGFQLRETNSYILLLR
jgi:ribosomal protein S18 acetylase RimI-like enzyme